MKYPDRIQFEFYAGKGGNGCSSFRRETLVPKGGPDGGNGGKGGSVYLVSNNGLLTFHHLQGQSIIKAPCGDDGTSANCNGKYGQHLYIEVPVGTQVFLNESDEVKFDFIEHNQQYCLAKGGVGGLGNKNFVKSNMQAPRHFTTGEKGESGICRLVLKHLANIGLIGMPNAGKSTLLSKISNAKVKIGDYAFSTLHPVLGTVNKQVWADLPGLLEGASNNVGLGHAFLQHIERCNLLVHCVNLTQEYKKNIDIILQELKLYNSELLNKKQVLALTHCDFFTKQEILEIKNELEIYDQPIFALYDELDLLLQYVQIN